MRKELVTHLDPKSPVSETFRTLRTNIQFMNSNRRLRSLLVTSTMPSEGKSWVASNLAVTFAQAGKRVALIDADMRKGRLYSIFGVEPRPGLSNYLSGYYENQEPVNIDKYLKKTDVNNLYLLPAGNIPPNPSELLVRRQMRNLLEQLKNQVDLIIIDGTPSKLVTDSVILSRIVDSTIIVSAHNQTRKDDLERVIKDIKNVGGNIAGVVYNKIPVSAKKYNQTYYYSSNVVTTKQQPDYDAERRKLQQRTQNALSQNTRRNGNHSEQNNRNMSNNINRNNQNIPEKKENMEVPRALRNDTKDDWHKIIDEERQNKNF
jgi:capsular exopolysaccharide synthesis family protein